MKQLNKTMIGVLVILVIVTVLSLSNLGSANLLEGMQCYWRMNATSGIELDYRGGNNNITTFNGTTRAVDGLLDEAISYDQTGDYVNTTQLTGLTDNTQGAISIWFNWSGLTNNNLLIGGFFSQDFSGTTYLAIQLDNRTTQSHNFVVTAIKDGVTQWQLGSTADSLQSIPRNRWHHLLINHNGTAARIYLNATDITDSYSTSTNVSVWLSGVLTDASTDATTFALSSPGEAGFASFIGRIDDVGIWERNLSDNEITRIYNSGVGLSYPFNEEEIISTLTQPANDTTTVNDSIVFNAVIDPIGLNLTNATIFVWFKNGSLFNETTNTLSGEESVTTSFNISDFPIGEYKWNVLGSGANETGNVSAFADLNFTLTTGYRFNDEDHDSPVTELSDQTFTLNLTLFDGLTSSDAVLIYNSSRNTASRTTAGDDSIYSVEITAPSTDSNVNVSWTWELTLNDGNNEVIYNVTDGTQEINVLSIDNCTTNTDLIFNYTLRDEEFRTKLNPTVDNTTMELELTMRSISDPSQNTTFARLYNQTNPAQVCVGSGTLNASAYRVDAIMRYEALSHVSEFHNLQNVTLTNNSGVTNIDLHDLATADSQEFLITFKDENFLPVEDALIDITRKYISDGVFRSVEIPKTDDDGQTLGHFVLSEAVYTIIVTKNGRLLATFDNVQAFCEDQSTGDCKINLNAFSSGTDPIDFTERNGLLFTLTFNESTRTITSVFSTTSGTSSFVELNGTRFDGYGNTTICSSSVSSSSGTLNCVIPSSFGNTTVVAELYKDGDFVSSGIFTIKRDSSSIFGAARVFMLLILITTIPLMFITSGIGVVLGAVIGFIIAGLLTIYEGGTIIGTSSTIMWFIIASGIIIWKINQRRTS